MTIEAGRVTPQLLEVLDLVGRAFVNEVDDAYLEQVRTYVQAPIAGLVPEAQKYAERGAHQLDSALKAYDKADDKPLWRDYLDASYAELFLGVTPKATEPVESCYMNDERILYAEQFFQVKEVMEATGFAIPSNFYEPADHIAMEWALLAHLLRAGDLERAASFKSAHMDTWIPRACTDLIDRDDVGFYTGIANIAKALLIELG